ncbi:MAG: hypothetical protein ACI4XL_04470 [Bacillus sp. (in: firmicutes)]
MQSSNYRSILAGLLLISFICLLSVSIIRLTKDHKELTYICSEVKRSYHQNYHFDTVNIDFNPAILSLDIKLNESFGEVPIIEQYDLLTMFIKQVRFFLWDKENSYINRNVQLKATLGNDQYLLKNTIKTNEPFANVKYELFKNNDLIYTNALYMIEVDKDAVMASLNQSTLEIMHYTEKLYKLLTVNGKLVKNDDAKLIKKNVMAKYQISEEEFKTICMEYLFRFRT